MHILEIPSFFEPHGGLFCLEQSKALKSVGHEVRILACVQLGVTIDRKFYVTAPLTRKWYIKDGVECYISYMRGLPKLVKLNYTIWCKTVRSMYEDYRQKYGKPDVIHAHCAKWAGVVARQISEQEGIPFYITEHLSSGLYEMDFRKGWTRETWIKDEVKKAYKDARCVLPVAKELVENVATFFGKDYKWKEVSNIIDTEFFAYKQRESLNNRPFRFCFIAVPNLYWKGYDVMAEAINGLHDCELHIAGPNKDNQDVRIMFSNSDNVILHGKLDKVGIRDLLYHCDALVLPSRSEVQPLVIFEALSTGIPVIGTTVVPESERIEGACTIVPVGDAEALHDAMLNFISQGHNYEGKVFHDRVEKLASLSMIADKLTRIFES